MDRKLKEHLDKDPEKDSDFARGKALAKEKGTPEGYDPITKERASVTFRQLFNETNGDETVARQIFNDVARAGGYGDGGTLLDQALDVRSLSRSVQEEKLGADRAQDLYAKRRHEQQAQHQDNLVNEVGEALRRLERG